MWTKYWALVVVCFTTKHADKAVDFCRCLGSASVGMKLYAVHLFIGPACIKPDGSKRLERLTVGVHTTQPKADIPKQRQEPTASFTLARSGQVDGEEENCDIMDRSGLS